MNRSGGGDECALFSALRSGADVFGSGCCAKAMREGGRRWQRGVSVHPGGPAGHPCTIPRPPSGCCPLDRCRDERRRMIGAPFALGVDQRARRERPGDDPFDLDCGMGVRLGSLIL